jgi:Tfp pilus assembly protein PilV
MRKDSNRIKTSSDNQSGQTLLEAVVTLAVALVIIGSVVTLVNSSNRRSNISRQATQASKLAQEGMEIVRNIRDVNDPHAVQVGSKAGPSPCNSGDPCSWSELYEVSQADPTNACLSYNGAAQQWRLLPAGNAACESIPIAGGAFSREISFADNIAIDTDDPPDGIADAICADSAFTEADTKRITVRVSWDSPTGPNARTVVSCLTDWR